MNVREILDPLIFCQLDDHSIWRQADLVKQVECSAVLKELIVKAIDAGIDEELAGKLQSRKGAEDRFAARAFQNLSSPMALGGLKECLRRMQCAVVRSANQALEGDIGLRTEVYDRLKESRQTPVLKNVVKQFDFFASPKLTRLADPRERDDRGAYRLSKLGEFSKQRARLTVV